MTVGQCLDAAATALQMAAAGIRSQRQPQPYDIFGALTARDLVYQELGRLTSLVRDRDPGQHMTWDDVLPLLGPDSDGHYIDPGSIVAASLHIARLGRQRIDIGLLTKHGTIPALIAPAATALGVAAEIIATHINPTEALHLRGRSSGPRRHYTRQHVDQNRHSMLEPLLRQRYRTAEGAALAAGALRDEAIGEIARLAAAAVDVDHALLRWEDQIYAGEWRLLHRWITSDVPATLAAIGESPPAVLLRALRPAPVQDRPHGPRNVHSLHDVHAVVAAARATVRRSPSQATVGLVGEVARLGFALTVAASRLHGQGQQPSPQAERDGAMWRSLAEITNRINDISDGHDPIFRLELGSAAIWLREQIRSGSVVPNRNWIDRTFEIQQELQKLCLELVDPLKLATNHRRLMTSSKALSVRVIGGARVVDNIWHTANETHPLIEELIRRLSVAGQPSANPEPQMARATTYEPRQSRQGLGDAPVDTARNLTRQPVSAAYPQPLRKALSALQQSENKRATPARDAAEHDGIQR